MFFAAGLLMLTSPLLTLVAALGRAVLLFWPTMLMFGAVHASIPAVPAFGYVTTFWLVALIGLLVPTGTALASGKS